MTRSLFSLFSFGFMLSIASSAFAAMPEGYALGFQPAVTPVAERMHEFHNLLFIIITAIVIFVSALLLYVIVRFNARANPVPSQTTHNTLLEILWTGVPVLILIIIAIPSFKLLYYSDRPVDPEMTLKVTGYQWYWGYEYPDYEGLSFMSNMVSDENIEEGTQKRNLSTDNVVVLPTDTTILIQVTAADVIHSFAMPAFGIKTDAVPGRLNETWVRITKPGTYYGQCSEICGINHAYMPIEIRAVPRDQFDAWLETAKEEFAANGITHNNLIFAQAEDL